MGDILWPVTTISRWVLSSRTAQGPSLDTRCWHHLTLCSGHGGRIRSHSMNVANSQLRWNNNNNSGAVGKRRTWQQVKGRQAAGLEVTYRIDFLWQCRFETCNGIFLDRHSGAQYRSILSLRPPAEVSFVFTLKCVYQPGRLVIQLHDLIWFKGPMRKKLSIGGRFLSKLYQSEWPWNNRMMIHIRRVFSARPYNLLGPSRFMWHCLYRRILLTLPRRAC